MNQTIWSAVDRYFVDTLSPSDPILDAALADSEAAGLPPHNVAPNQGKFLQLLARMVNARSILEIGTLGGYSTIWLARALGPEGRLISLEHNPKHAEVAAKNIARAGLDSIVELRVGAAADILPQLVGCDAAPFDLIFIDADKPNNPTYLHWALELGRKGTVIVGDNVVRNGLVADNNSVDPNVQGVRRFIDLIAADPRLAATALQTVGSKGYDGFALAIIV